MNYKKNYQKCANLFKDSISVSHDLLKTSFPDTHGVAHAPCYYIVTHSHTPRSLHMTYESSYTYGLVVSIKA